MASARTSETFKLGRVKRIMTCQWMDLPNFHRFPPSKRNFCNWQLHTKVSAESKFALRCKRNLYTFKEVLFSIWLQPRRLNAFVLLVGCPFPLHTKCKHFPGSPLFRLTKVVRMWTQRKTSSLQSDTSGSRDLPSVIKTLANGWTLPIFCFQGGTFRNGHTKNSARNNCVGRLNITIFHLSKKQLLQLASWHCVWLDKLCYLTSENQPLPHIKTKYVQRRPYT